MGPAQHTQRAAFRGSVLETWVCTPFLLFFSNSMTALHQRRRAGRGCYHKGQFPSEVSHCSPAFCLPLTTPTKLFIHHKSTSWLHNTIAIILGMGISFISPQAHALQSLIPSRWHSVSPGADFEVDSLAPLPFLSPFTPTLLPVYRKYFIQVPAPAAMLSLPTTMSSLPWRTPSLRCYNPKQTLSLYLLGYFIMAAESSSNSNKLCSLVKTVRLDKLIALGAEEMPQQLREVTAGGGGGLEFGSQHPTLTPGLQGHPHTPTNT